jgi:hypothetical protein
MSLRAQANSLYVTGRTWEQAAPRLCEFRAGMSALEETFTVPIFELFDLCTQCRLRDVKLTRCSAKTQLLCNGDECNEVTEIWALIHNALTWLLYSAGRKMHAETRNKEVVKTNWNPTTLDSLGLCTHSE